jgi:FAD:protein FMN transferase
MTLASTGFPAFGCAALVAVTDSGRLDTALAAVHETVDAFDLACSRFLPDSELSALNRAAGMTVRVGPLLLEAVRAGLRAAELTDGDVDPTLGEALIALGYDRDFEEVRERAVAPRLAATSVAGWRTIRVEPGASTVCAGRGVTLDLGATAKALASDHAATAAHAAAGCPVLVSLGGDLAIAGGAPEGGWRVRVTDDHRAGVEAPGQWITLQSGGLATSSTVARRWRAGDRELHHLLDPASGLPVRSAVRTASVAAATCLDANIASTAAIVRGDRAAAWLEARGLPSRLVGNDGAVRHVAGWPAAGDDLSPRAEAEAVA